MESAPRNPDEENIKRQEMIAAINSGIESEDYTFVVDIARSQDFLRPYEIVEYMDVKRRSSEDPVQQRRWEDGLNNYLTSLNDQEFPEEEVKIINTVIERLQFDRMVTNEEVADEPEVQRRDADPNDIDWENDYFQPAGIDSEEIKRLSETPIGQSVVRTADKAISYGETKYLKEARLTISKFKFGSTEKLKDLLDIYVCKFAENRANKAISYGETKYLKTAIESLREFGSSDEAVLAMEKNLDKLVFEFAEKRLAKAVSYNDNSYIQQAIDALDQFVSTKARQAAMLEKLGLK